MTQLTSNLIKYSYYRQDTALMLEREAFGSIANQNKQSIPDALKLSTASTEELVDDEEIVTVREQQGPPPLTTSTPEMLSATESKEHADLENTHKMPLNPENLARLNAENLRKLDQRLSGGDKSAGMETNRGTNGSGQVDEVFKEGMIFL